MGDILIEEAVEAATEAASKAEADGSSPEAVLRAQRAERTAIRSAMEQLISTEAASAPPAAPVAPAAAGQRLAAVQSLAERFGDGGAEGEESRREAWRRETAWDDEDAAGAGAGAGRLEAYERQIESEAVYEASRYRAGRRLSGACTACVGVVVV